MRAEFLSSVAPAVRGAARELAGLARFEGSAEAFWPEYLRTIGQALPARRVLLLASAIGRPWQARAQWPARGAEREHDARWTLESVGSGIEESTRVVRNDRDEIALVMTLAGHGDASGQIVAVVALDVDAQVWDEPSLQAWAELAGAIPAAWMSAAASPTPTGPHDRGGSSADAEARMAASPDTVPSQVLAQRAQRIHAVLQSALRMQQETRFIALAMAVCNDLAMRYDCERVSLGWVDEHYVRLVAVSHIEHFDARASATRALEAAMEEALDQDSVLVHPPPLQDGGQVLAAHQAYVERVGLRSHLTSVPLSHGDRVYAVLCLERQAAALDEDEQWELQQLMQAVARWFRHLHDRDRWFGARLWSALREQAATVLKPRHVAAKLAGLVSVVLLALLSLLPWPYRVDASLAIRSQDLLFMPAPFDGYLSRVNVLVGDAVDPGAILVELDTRDLALEASAAEADFVRFSRESEKALAAGQLAEMQIASARAQQAAARLEIVRHQLRNAQVRAPYAGVVIEGDLRKNLGAPVRKGDLLLKLARTADSFIELEIDQAFIHEVRVGSRGQFSLVGKPEERFDIGITRIEPAATHRDGRTFYLARAELIGQGAGQWRPGMGGNARIDVGDRAPLWIMTHRTVRFLREYFWL